MIQFLNSILPSIAQDYSKYYRPLASINSLFIFISLSSSILLSFLVIVTFHYFQNMGMDWEIFWYQLEGQHYSRFTIGITRFFILHIYLYLLFFDELLSDREEKDLHQLSIGAIFSHLGTSNGASWFVFLVLYFMISSLFFQPLFMLEGWFVYEGYIDLTSWSAMSSWLPYLINQLVDVSMDGLPVLLLVVLFVRNKTKVNVWTVLTNWKKEIAFLVVMGFVLRGALIFIDTNIISRVFVTLYHLVSEMTYFLHGFKLIYWMFLIQFFWLFITGVFYHSMVKKEF